MVKLSLSKEGGYHIFIIKIIPEIGNTLVKEGGSYKKKTIKSLFESVLGLKILESKRNFVLKKKLWVQKFSCPKKLLTWLVHLNLSPFSTDWTDTNLT